MKKAMIVYRYYLKHPAPDIKRERNTNTKDEIKYNTTSAESQEYICFPSDGHQAILNKANRQTDNEDRPQQKRRLGTVSNTIVAGLNVFHAPLLCFHTFTLRLLVVL